MKRTIIALLLVLTAAALCGCKKESNNDNCMWSNTKSKYPSKAAYREYLKDQVICPQHNVSLAQDEKFNPGCETSLKMLLIVDRMLKNDWCERDIQRNVDMYTQGRRIMETIPNAKSCNPGNGRLRLDFFIMSLCPYGLQFVNTVLPELLRETGDTIDWEPHYIIELKDGKYTSMHGEAEVQEDKVELCLYKNWGKQKWLDYMRCFQQTVSSSKLKGDAAVTDSSKTCLATAGADSGQMNLCLTNQIGKLLEDDLRIARSSAIGGSPTAIYNCNKRIVGAVPFNMVKPSICELYPAKMAPEACKL